MMNKVDNIADAQIPQRNHTTKAHEHHRAHPLESYRQEILDNVALTGNGPLGMKVVQHSISMQFSSSSREIITSEEIDVIEENNTSLFDFEKVAENVLNFIGGRIRLAKEEGSSNDELEAMFNQARTGVTRGFEQALGELDELGVLDDELTNGIEKSRGLIFQGIDELEQSYFPTNNQAEKSEDSEVSKLDSENIVTSLNTELYASSKRTSDLVITTLDGDKVSIAFSDIQQAEKNDRYTNDKDQVERFESSSSSYRTTHFSYTIEGDISDDEQQAIASLIKDVNMLQKDFFKGDIEKAFDHAMNLGFDTGQIAEFSMELYQSKTTKVSQAYSEVANADQKVLPSQEKTLRPLIDFVKQLQVLQDQTDRLLENQNGQFFTLFEKVFEAEFSHLESYQENLQQLEKVTTPFIKEPS
ncbi:DUF5610 domain-containing protein [Thalassotalea castellviae]|uniref:DUF5610 domain-containing protein n=1 Tax=Thalassotalea castellviae TaxID=3075612 RepID=A0ABU3A407_9GAMM|nr:DUF5610 domain-containing protein [Thalassotalea sp. W431]MDT0604913.1 DUF5610 domain-containing protein [Thalassotalea sp. W431]